MPKSVVPEDDSVDELMPEWGLDAPPSLEGMSHIEGVDVGVTPKELFSFGGQAVDFIPRAHLTVRDCRLMLLALAEDMVLKGGLVNQEKLHMYKSMLSVAQNGSARTQYVQVATGGCLWFAC